MSLVVILGLDKLLRADGGGWITAHFAFVMSLLGTSGLEKA